MESHVKLILEASGIVVRDDRQLLFKTMEDWLAFNDSYDGLTVEDCAPLSPQVYQATISLLESVWKPDSNQTIQNALLESKMDPDEISLQAVYDSVRATRWLRQWMELVVDSNKSLSQKLLEQDSQHSLLDSLYQYIQDLPQLQSQMHLYTQSLQRSNASKNNTSTALSNPQDRLRQYARAQRVAQHLNEEWGQHMERLDVIVADWYETSSAAGRRRARRLLGRVWSSYVQQCGAVGLRQENTRAAGIKLTLRVLHRILLGVDKIQASHEHLLFQQLVPLHQPDAMVLWRDQVSVLELYHEPLVQCMAVLLQKKPSLVPSVISSLIQPEVFPPVGNTPKQVLLLHEIDTYIGLLDEEAVTNNDSMWFASLLAVLSRCMTSDHSRVAERALEFFRNKQFKQLIDNHYADSLRTLLPALVKREPSWNPTVRKMTYTVLKDFHDRNPVAFERGANGIIDRPTPSTGSVSSLDMNGKTAPKTHISPVQSTQLTVPRDFSLKAGMGSWRPPTSTQHRISGSHAPSSLMPPPAVPGHRPQQPPSTVTGVAPWAQAGTGAQPPSTVTGVAPWASTPNASAAAPPLTVTGVAPWSTQQQSPAGVHKRRAQEAQLCDISEEMPDMGTNGTELKQLTGYEFVLKYMEKLKPPEEEQGVSTWSKIQMAETPTLLPHLKFHDLVFGHDLGSGAFGTVRYARLIDRLKTRSHWAEYAVKVISTEKIRELGYEASVQREIAVLRILSHPGIARLISSFRFREGAYLVLEYASGGDLHSLLRKHGSLDHKSTRFVVGEIVAALSSIHELGLVYSDLKAENVLITEPGHIKLTDFGGCRPVTKVAKSLVDSIAKDLLKKLRDGDWKAKDADGDDAMHDETDTEMEEDDDRIEGTTSYLPPEVVMGSIPTVAADSWALGCLTYQCLSGRPPFLEADDEMTRRRIVNFDIEEQQSSEVDRLFEDKLGSGIEPNARELIKSLLQRNPSLRPDMGQVAETDFFRQEGVDVFSLHNEPAFPLDVGSVAPLPDAQWSRRQFSSIWAPQPVAYDISLPDDNPRPFLTVKSNSSPIREGEEASGFFSPSGKLPKPLGKIAERLVSHLSS